MQNPIVNGSIYLGKQISKTRIDPLRTTPTMPQALLSEMLETKTFQESTSLLKEYIRRTEQLRIITNAEIKLASDRMDSENRRISASAKKVHNAARKAQKGSSKCAPEARSVWAGVKRDEPLRTEFAIRQIVWPEKERILAEFDRDVDAAGNRFMEAMAELDEEFKMLIQAGPPPEYETESTGVASWKSKFWSFIRRRLVGNAVW